MLYVKAIAVGIVSGLALAVAWFVVAVWIPFQNRPEGSHVAVSIRATDPLSSRSLGSSWASCGPCAASATLTPIRRSPSSSDLLRASTTTLDVTEVVLAGLRHSLAVSPLYRVMPTERLSQISTEADHLTDRSHEATGQSPLI
jgi:hypothetical protein